MQSHFATRRSVLATVARVLEQEESISCLVQNFLQASRSLWPIMLVVAYRQIYFKASVKNPLVLVGKNDAIVSHIARSLVFLDYPSYFLPEHCALLSDPSTHVQHDIGTSDQIAWWRSRVAYISLFWSGPPDVPSGDMTVGDTFRDGRRFRANREKPGSAVLCDDVLERSLSSLGLHPSTQYAPWQDLTRKETSLAMVSIALALSPCVIILDGEPTDSSASQKIVRVVRSRGISLVWANCSSGTQHWMSTCRGASVEQLPSVTCPSGDVVDDKAREPNIRRWSPPSAVFARLPDVFQLFVLATLVAPVLAEVSPRAATMVNAVGGTPMNRAARDVQPWQLILCSLAILAVMGIVWLLELGLQGAIFIAGLRCAAQLSVLGYILVPVFRIDTWWLVLGYLCGMVVVGAQEASARPAYRYPGMHLDVLQVLVCVFFIVLGFGVFVLQSGFSALVVIPIGGMLLNACLSSTALALSNGLAYLAENKSNVEFLLCLGATRLEATRDCIKRSVTIGITPMRLTMLTSGIVSISGMMAGQLLAGATPINAARYQIVVLFLIMAATAFACTAATVLSIFAIVDDWHRVRSERLSRRDAVNHELISRIWTMVVMGFSAFYQQLSNLLPRRDDGVDENQPLVLRG